MANGLRNFRAELGIETITPRYLCRRVPRLSIVAISTHSRRRHCCFLFCISSARQLIEMSDIGSARIRPGATAFT